MLFSHRLPQLQQLPDRARVPVPQRGQAHGLPLKVRAPAGVDLLARGDVRERVIARVVERLVLREYAPNLRHALPPAPALARAPDDALAPRGERVGQRVSVGVLVHAATASLVPMSS